MNSIKKCKTRLLLGFLSEPLLYHWDSDIRFHDLTTTFDLDTDEVDEGLGDNKQKRLDLVANTTNARYFCHLPPFSTCMRESEKLKESEHTWRHDFRGNLTHKPKIDKILVLMHQLGPAPKRIRAHTKQHNCATYYIKLFIRGFGGFRSMMMMQ